jgi:hypothetical protein
MSPTPNSFNFLGENMPSKFKNGSWALKSVRLISSFIKINKTYFFHGLNLETVKISFLKIFPAVFIRVSIVKMCFF